MIVCITGATGFIGRKLAECHLRLNDEVRYLTRTNGQLISGAKAFVGNVNSAKKELNLFLENVDIFYHCAGELKNEAVMHATHVQGTLNLLNMIQQRQSQTQKEIHWIQLSSCGAYGQAESSRVIGRCVDESSHESPSGEYECTKTEADDFVKAYANKYNWFKYTIIRPTIIFGSGMKSTAIVRLASLVKKKLFFYVGNKNAIANYVHVDDVVKAMVIAANEPNAYNQTFIVSNDCKFSEVIDIMAEALSVSKPKWIVNEFLLRKFVSLIGRWTKLPINNLQIDMMTRQTYYSNQKLRECLKWAPLALAPAQLKQYIEAAYDISI